MVQQDEKKNSSIPVSGTIERINEKGIKVNGEWFNFSKFLTNIPKLEEGYGIDFKASKNFINEITTVAPPKGSPIEIQNCTTNPKKAHTGTDDASLATSAADAGNGGNKVETSSAKAGGPRSDQPQKKGPVKDYEILGNCLKDAVYITDDIHEVKFSTTDIVKLALTLFIHRTS